MWVKDRHEYQGKILNFFVDKPDKLIIVNIENNNWENFICKKLNLKVPERKKYHTSRLNTDDIKKNENTVKIFMKKYNINNNYFNNNDNTKFFKIYENNFSN